MIKRRERAHQEILDAALEALMAEKKVNLVCEAKFTMTEVDGTPMQVLPLGPVVSTGVPYSAALKMQKATRAAVNQLLDDLETLGQEHLAAQTGTPAT